MSRFTIPHAEEEEEFFRISPSFIGHELCEEESSIKSFVVAQMTSDKPVVCVTSGGTTVPLERRTVRYIDNFSTGNRGAACTESFLASGYAVIFLHRKGSAFPYKRHMESERSPAELVASLAEAESSSEALASMTGDVEALRCRVACVDLRVNMLAVPFTTIFEYLFLLRAVSRALKPMGPKAVLFLAAAVSDFYIPEIEMARDKIQSAQSGLTLNLTNVPKMLGRIKQRAGLREEEGGTSGPQCRTISADTEGWAPNAFLVSFKLETNENILEAKAAGALLKYGVDVVVSNLLGRHTHEANIISRNGGEDVRVFSHSGGIQGDEEAQVEVEGIRSIRVVCEDGKPLETGLVENIIEAHQLFIEENSC